MGKRWVLLAVVFVGCASSSQFSDERRWREGIREARNQQALSVLFRSPPASCRPYDWDHEICLWQRDTRQRIVIPQLPIQTPPVTLGGKIQAFCVLPLDGRDRGPGSCQLVYDKHPDRRSGLP